jgi:hypothetical protein
MSSGSVLRWGLVLGLFFWVSGRDVSKAADELSQGQRRALILASNVAGSQLAGPRCLKAANEIARTLQRVGFAAGEISSLLADDPSGSKSLDRDEVLSRVGLLANQAAANDVIMLIVLGQGVQTKNGDAVLLPAGTADDSSVLVSELIEKLGTSAARQQLLVVDGNGFSRAVGQSGFNFSKVKGTASQQILLNTYSPLPQTDGSVSKLPEFWQVLCDGLTELADQNSDGRVTGDELSEYVLGYFASHSLLPAPVGSGQLGEGFAVAVPAAAGASRFSQQARDQIASRMLQNAHQVLLVEHQPAAALEMLQRAGSYRPNADIGKRIRGMWLCSMASNGNIEAAWDLASKDGQSLMVWVGGSVTLQNKSESVVTDPDGELLELQDKSETGFRVVRRVLVRVQDGKIQFTTITDGAQTLTVSVAALKSAFAANKQNATDVAADEVKFLQSLRKLSGM